MSIGLLASAMRSAAPANESGILRHSARVHIPSFVAAIVSHRSREIQLWRWHVHEGGVAAPFVGLAMLRVCDPAIGCGNFDHRQRQQRSAALRSAMEGSAHAGSGSDYAPLLSEAALARRAFQRDDTLARICTAVQSMKLGNFVLLGPRVTATLGVLIIMGITLWPLCSIGLRNEGLGSRVVYFDGCETVNGTALPLDYCVHCNDEQRPYVPMAKIVPPVQHDVSIAVVACNSIVLCVVLFLLMRTALVHRAALALLQHGVLVYDVSAGWDVAAMFVLLLLAHLTVSAFSAVSNMRLQLRPVTLACSWPSDVKVVGTFSSENPANLAGECLVHASIDERIATLALTSSGCAQVAWWRCCRAPLPTLSPLRWPSATCGRGPAGRWRACLRSCRNTRTCNPRCGTYGSGAGGTW